MRSFSTRPTSVSSRAIPSSTAITRSPSAASAGWTNQRPNSRGPGGWSRSTPKGRGNREIELDEDDEANAPGRAEQAKESPEGVERLGDLDPPADGRGRLVAVVGLEEPIASGVAPARVQRSSEKDYVYPVFEQGGPIRVEFREELGGKRHECNGEKEAEVQPSEVPVGAHQMIDLGLLPDPEEAQGDEAHQVHDELWQDAEKRVAQPVLA